MLLKVINTEKLVTEIYETRDEMGRAAAASAAKAINAVLEEKRFANVIFAAAPSQNEMLAALLKEDVDFSRINAFHMDEYAGLGLEDEQSFARFLCDSIFSKAPFATVNYIPAKSGAEDACEYYSELLKKNPPDVVCMGIGGSGFTVSAFLAGAITNAIPGIILQIILIPLISNIPSKSI